MTVALPSSECNSLAAARTASVIGVLPFWGDTADRGLNSRPTVGGGLHQSLDVAAIVLLPMAVGHKAKFCRRRPTVDETVHNLAGDLHFALAVDMRVHAARSIEHQNGFIGDRGR